MKHKVICLILCLLLFPSLFLSTGAEQQYVIEVYPMSRTF